MVAATGLISSPARAQIAPLLKKNELIYLWPGLAPGETDRKSGTVQPPKAKDPSINRIEDISAPSIKVYPSDRPNGTAIVILPGGGYRYVVDNMEGSEMAPIFNPLGLTVFVVSYRVSGDKSPQAWRKPVQDAQRAIRWVRHHADRYAVAPDKVGLMGFSAGGQAATIATTATQAYYKSTDPIDSHPCVPDFSMLVYPWRLESAEGKLRSMITVTPQTPPTLIVHTHDDKSALSTGSAKLYLALKEANVETELHIFRSGGHGYGLRRRPNSNIHRWPELAVDWLRLSGWARVQE